MLQLLWFYCLQSTCISVPFLFLDVFALPYSFRLLCTFTVLRSYVLQDFPCSSEIHYLSWTQFLLSCQARNTYALVADTFNYLHVFGAPPPFPCHLQIIPVVVVCSYPVFNLFISYVQTVHILCSTCSYPMLNLFISCVQPVHILCSTCSYPVFNLFVSCVQPVHILCSTCSYPVFNVFVSCVQPVHILCSTCSYPMFSLSIFCVQPVRILCSTCSYPVFNLFVSCVQPVHILCSTCSAAL